MVPTTRVTVPTCLQGQTNGAMSPGDMRAPDSSTRADFKMFMPVSYAMQAFHLAAAGDGLEVMTTGRYRSYAQQESLFRSRYSPSPVTTRGSKIWNGVRWYNQQGAMAATPGTSNHGLGLADDIAEQRDADPAPEDLSNELLAWMESHAAGFGFGIETYKETWHWHWIGGNALSKLVVTTLADAGITVPDMSRFGFTVPQVAPPQPPPEEDVKMISIARLDSNQYHYRRGDGNVATILRSNEYVYLKTLFDQGNAPPYVHPLTREVITKWADVPVLNETQLDLWVGYVDGSSLNDEG